MKAFADQGICNGTTHHHDGYSPSRETSTLRVMFFPIGRALAI